jgi:hypothetical protein
MAPPAKTIRPRDFERRPVPGEGGSLETLVMRLRSDSRKGPILQRIGELLDASGGRGFDEVLPDLITLSKSRFAADVERVLAIIGGDVGSAELIDVVLPLLLDDDPLYSVEFLVRVVACASRPDLEPRIRRIMNLIVPLLQHEVPEVRKYSVLCVVELRMVMGRGFDREIESLRTLQRKLVRHYFQKRIHG